MLIRPGENDDDASVDEDNAVNVPLETADDASSEVTVTTLLFVSGRDRVGMRNHIHEKKIHTTSCNQRQLYDGIFHEMW